MDGLGPVVISHVLPSLVKLLYEGRWEGYAESPNVSMGGQWIAMNRLSQEGKGFMIGVTIMAIRNTILVV